MNLAQFSTLLNTLACLRLRAESRRYFLGYLWWILEPLLYVLVFYVVFEKLLQGRKSDYLAFLMVGKLTFVWFSKSVSQAGNSFETNKGLMAQLNLPKALFPLSVTLEGIYRQMPVFGFLLIFLIGYGFDPNVQWFWLFPLILTQGMLIIGCGLASALLVCLQRDFKFLIQLGMVFLLFMSGIFWDIRDIRDDQLLNCLLILNPLATLVDAFRQVLMHGTAPDLTRICWVLVQSVLLVLVMCFLYSRLQFWIANRVLSR